MGGDTISLRDLKFMLDYHLVMGLTWFNVHGLYYTLDGERRDEAPPSLFYQHSQWPHMPEFLSYLKRRCSELSGEHLCELEMLYPSTVLQTRLPSGAGPDRELHLTAEELVSHQRDFELIDEVTLAEQDPAAFAALRPYFLVAHAARIERSTAKWLEAYAAAGGTVLVTGVTPEILPEPDGRTAEKWSFAESHRENDFVRKIPAPEANGTGAENILIRRIRKDGRDRTFLFNRGGETFRGTFDGEAVELAPGEAGFADELRVRKPAPVLPLNGWTLSFGPNCVPLNYWESSIQDAFDLISKRNVGLHPVPEEGEFWAVFTLGSPLENIWFTTEESSLARAEFSLNGTPLTGFRKAQFRDCRELECEVTAFLKPGRNILTCRGRLIENAPYLRGRFKAAFPLGNCGYPVLSAAPEKFQLTLPQDYRTLGYGTFAGTAVYETTVQIAKNGRYTLDMRLSADSVRIMVDGTERGMLIAPPYRLEVELAAGEHTIWLEVCNAPGNRDILAGLPAGLQA